jgi:hypothetical protein
MPLAVVVVRIRLAELVVQVGWVVLVALQPLEEMVLPTQVLAAAAAVEIRLTLEVMVRMAL